MEHTKMVEMIRAHIEELRVNADRIPAMAAYRKQELAEWGEVLEAVHGMGVELAELEDARISLVKTRTERDRLAQQVDKLQGILEMANNTAMRRGKERDCLAAMVERLPDLLAQIVSKAEVLRYRGTFSDENWAWVKSREIKALAEEINVTTRKED